MGGVAAVTLLCRAAAVNATTSSLAYLLLVLVVAAKWRLRQAILTSVLATLCFNVFFLPPVGTLTIADPENWIALGAFLITAVIASELSDRLQQQRATAIDQRRDLERLYTLSRAVLLDTGEGPIGGLIATRIAEIFGFSAVLLYDLRARKTYHSGPEDLRVPQDKLERQEIAQMPEGAQAVSVRLGNKAIGVLVVKGEIDTSALDAVANLAAINLEKVANQEIANQARVSRQNEELKSSILDALAHEFKTPLTSIKAACTSLLAAPRTPPEESRELLDIINEETDRLTALVDDAIQVSRIEAGRVRLAKAPANADGIFNAVFSQMKPRFEDRAVSFNVEPDLPSLLVDRDLIELAVRQLVDNALKYSPPGSSISFHATRSGGHVRLSVQDAGAAIPISEQSKVFEKFYRGEKFRGSLPGSGVGLSVVRDIAKAHSGAVSITSNGKQGNTFTMELPALKEDRR